VTLTVDLADADGSRAALPIKAFDSAGAIALADAGSLDGPGRCLTGTARLSPSGRATEIRLFPAPLGSRVRVLRVRIG
jgi:hypothetical protein